MIRRTSNLGVLVLKRMQCIEIVALVIRISPGI